MGCYKLDPGESSGCCNEILNDNEMSFEEQASECEKQLLELLKDIL